MNIVLFWLFPFISTCIIHVLYLLCCVLSAYLEALWNIIYRASVYCIPKRNDRPLAEDLSESRLFTLETIAEWKSAGQSTIYHFCTTAHRKILHHQHWDYKQTCPLLHFCGFFCLHSEYRYRSAGLQRRSISVTHLWWVRFTRRKLLATFNHGCSLLAGGLSALHYRPILLQRMYSAASADRVAHITCRPLINQTRALS